MVDLPQPAWPLTFATMPDGSVQFADVDQDSPQDRQARAAVVACTPRGHRDDDPSFGITPLVFQQGPINTDRLLAELAQADPGLDDMTADEALDLTAATLRTITANVGQDLA